MRRVGRDAQGLTCTHGRFFSAEGGFDLTFQEGEGFLEVVPMRRRTAPGRNMHVDEAIATVSIGARKQNGVGIADKSDVGQAFVGIGPRDLETVFEVVGGKRRDRAGK